MFDFNKYYKDKDEERRKAELESKLKLMKEAVRRQNYTADLICEIASTLAVNAEFHPPEQHSTISLGGKSYVSWNCVFDQYAKLIEVCNSDDYIEISVNLLPDGRLFNVKTGELI